MLPAARDILARKCAEGMRLVWLHCLAKTFAVLCGIKDGSRMLRHLVFLLFFHSVSITVLTSTPQSELQTSPFFHVTPDLLCFCWIFFWFYFVGFFLASVCGSVSLPSTT